MLPFVYVDKPNIMVVFYPIKDRKSSLNQKPKNRAASSKAYRPESIVSLARKNSSVLAGIRDSERVAKRSTKRFSGQPSKQQHKAAAHKMPLPQEPRQKPVRFRMPAPLKKTAPLKKPVPLKKAVSFSFTLPLLPVLGFIILGTIFFVDNRNSISYLLYRDVIPVPQADSGGESSMAAFVNSSGHRYLPFPNEEMSAADMIGSQSLQTGALPTVMLEESGSDPIQLAMMEYFEWIDYTVRRGDSVSSIAVSHGLSMDAVIASNNMSNAHLLRVGQRIRLPNMNGIPYTVKSGDSLSGISESYNIPIEVLADVNNIQQDLILPGELIFLPGARMPARDLRLAMGNYFISPLRGYRIRLSSPFGWRIDPFHGRQAMHEGIDMAIAPGTPVRAAAAGRIAVVGNNPVYGLFIIMEHGTQGSSDNYQTLYAHLSAFSVRQGERVEQNARIGSVGNTGLSTGPHLHFSVYRNGRAVNPLDYISL